MGAMLLEVGAASVPDISSTIQSSFQGIQGQMIGAISAVAGVAIVILGVSLSWRYAKNFFKSLSRG